MDKRSCQCSWVENQIEACIPIELVGGEYFFIREGWRFLIPRCPNCCKQLKHFRGYTDDEEQEIQDLRDLLARLEKIGQLTNQLGSAEETLVPTINDSRVWVRQHNYHSKWNDR